MEKRIRTLTFLKAHKIFAIPALLIGGKWLNKLYGWEVGDLVEIVQYDDGIFIKKFPRPPNPNQLKLFKGGEQ